MQVHKQNPHLIWQTDQLHTIIYSWLVTDERVAIFVQPSLCPTQPTLHVDEPQVGGVLHEGHFGGGGADVAAVAQSVPHSPTALSLDVASQPQHTRQLERPPGRVTAPHCRRGRGHTCITLPLFSVRRHPPPLTIKKISD